MHMDPSFKRTTYRRRTTVWPHHMTGHAQAEAPREELPAFTPTRPRRALHEMPQPKPRAALAD